MLNVGASQIDITPPVGADLGGFLGRVQPSESVLDPLFAKALYLEQGPRRLLWVHLDLLGVPRQFVQEFRAWAQRELALRPDQVMVSATHTHCGPPVVYLHQCGRVDEQCVAALKEKMRQAATQAAGRTEPCEVVSAHAELTLAIDRRGKPSSATDPRVGGLGFRASDGRFVAAVAIYSMHPVSLGASRSVSAEWPGETASALSSALPGEPVVLVSSGACGNLNPPRVAATVEEKQWWGRRVAEAIGRPLLEALPQPDAAIRTASRPVVVPLAAMPPRQIDDQVEGFLSHLSPSGKWTGRITQAFRDWQASMKSAIAAGAAVDRADAELFVVAIGSTILVGVSAETFCQFTRKVRQSAGRDVYTIGCANGMIGYLPHSEAFAEGGYETDSAYVYYGTFPVQPGSLERLADEAAAMVTELGGA